MRDARGLLPRSRRSARMSCRTGAKPPSASERVPGWFRGELQIADVDPKPRADAGADWNHNHLVVHRRREPEASDHIGRAVQTNKAGVKPISKERLCGGKVVHEHHRAPAIPAEVKAQRRPLPVDPALACIAGVEHPFTKAQATKDRCRGFLAHDVAVRFTPAAD